MKSKLTHNVLKKLHRRNKMKSIINAIRNSVFELNLSSYSLGINEEFKLRPKIRTKATLVWESDNLVNFSIDENGNNWLTPVKVGPTDLTITGENGVTNILPVVVVDVDYVYGRLNTNNVTGNIVGNWTNNRYDNVIGGETYKFSTLSYVR